MKSREFVITVLAVVVGFIVGKKISQLMSKAGVPIADDNAMAVDLQGNVVTE